MKQITSSALYIEQQSSLTHHKVKEREEWWYRQRWKIEQKKGLRDGIYNINHTM